MTWRPEGYEETKHVALRELHRISAYRGTCYEAGFDAGAIAKEEVLKASGRRVTRTKRGVENGQIITETTVEGYEIFLPDGE